MKGGGPKSSKSYQRSLWMPPYLVIAVIVYLVWTKIAVVPFWLLANAHGNRSLDVRLLPKSRRISSPLFLTAWHGSGFDDCVGSFGTSGNKEKTVFFCNCSLHNVKDRLSIFIVHFTRNFNPQRNPIQYFLTKMYFPNSMISDFNKKTSQYFPLLPSLAEKTGWYLP